MITLPSGRIVVEFEGHVKTTLSTLIPRQYGLISSYEPFESLEWYHTVEGVISEEEREAIGEFGKYLFMWAHHEYQFIGFVHGEHSWKRDGVLIIRSVNPVEPEHEIFHDEKFHHAYIYRIKKDMATKESEEFELLLAKNNFSPIMSLEV